MLSNYIFSIPLTKTGVRIPPICLNLKFNAGIHIHHIIMIYIVFIIYTFVGVNVNIALCK